MAAKWLRSLLRPNLVPETVTISSLTLNANSLGYWNAGVPTQAGDGTPIHFLIQKAVTPSDTEMELFPLEPGDVLEIDYTGATTNLKRGDKVDLDSGGQVADATDETIGSDGQLEVLKIDTVNTKLHVKYLGR